jgi:phosphoserine phosphatase RsbU/P
MTANDSDSAALVAQLKGLTEIGRMLTYAMSLEQVLELTVEKAIDLLKADKAVLMLAREDGLLSVRASRGITQELAERFREPFTESLSARLASLLGEGSSFLGVPLVAGGSVTGILAVAKREGDKAPELAELLLSALADQAAIALEKARLGEATEFRERLMGIVGHDLKNPLTAVKMSVQLLNADNTLTDRQRRAIGAIDRSSERMLEIIRQLLDFTRSRLGSGIPIEPQDVDFNEVCRQVLAELEMAYPGREIRLVPAPVSTGRWDPARLEQLISNLAANALEHGKADAPVEVRVRRMGSETFVDVHNEGEPIPRERISKLFDPFVHGGSGDAQHLGLGLYISKEIVVAHGGTISVDSNAKGVTFTVCLPTDRDRSTNAP